MSKDIYVLTLDMYRIENCFTNTVEAPLRKGVLLKSKLHHNDDDYFELAGINNNTIDLNKVNTYYRYPKLDLSRDKMLNLREKYGIKKVLDKDKADFHIISEKTISNYTDIIYNASLSSPASVKAMLLKHPKAFKPELLTELVDKLEEIEGVIDTIVISATKRYYYHNTGGTPTVNHAQALTEEILKSGTDNMRFVQHHNVDAWKSIFNGSKTLISDVTMNDMASEDSVVIDAEMYDRLTQMLNSNSTEDVTMAMSTMSNSNIKESKTFLAMLFFNHSGTLRTGKMWNQVGFRTIKKQFDKYVTEHGYHHTDRYSSFVRSLAEDDALTLDSISRITDMVFDRVINSNCGFNQERCAFAVEKTNITLKPEYVKQIKDGKTLSEILLSNNEPLEEFIF